ncbi:transcription initiation factor TFIID subunit 2 [Clonorchis sinensis]|uniref:Transcription initiation factor TFIID subunit 2 n=1 Tax=Clonorchis sinensis TaxID=79923 RepID=H2KTD2_CLOSI|nr:transcription initiation factor TFIID subunit 2 [Clonorchis sinensis]
MNATGNHVATYLLLKPIPSKLDHKLIIVIITDSMISVSTTGNLLPYTHDLFESVTVKKRIKVYGKVLTANQSWTQLDHVAINHRFPCPPGFTIGPLSRFHSTHNSSGHFMFGNGGDISPRFEQFHRWSDIRCLSVPDDPWTTPVGPSIESTQPAITRGFRLSHQNLCITQIDFEQRLLVGFTQLILWPTTSDLRRVHLNCRQCRIHRVLLEPADPNAEAYEQAVSGASVKWTSAKTHRFPVPTDLPVIYHDPSLEICSRDTKLRTLDCFQRDHTLVAEKTDPDKHAGEVTIRIPPDFWPLISFGRPFRITLEFSLNKPKSGFYFVVPPGEGSLVDRGVHAFTASMPNSSRLWFPCIDCAEPCTWKIEITVFEDMVAVAPGELLDAPYYTEDLTHKTYHFYVAQPVAAPYIGLAVGAFEVYPDPVLSNNATHFCPGGLLNLLKHTVSHLPDIIEHFEALLASQYPFSTINTVFVDRAYGDFQAFASLLIFPVDLLHSSRIIDQAIETRKILSLAISSQFFGCFITGHTWCDAWLPMGIAGYLSGLYQKRVFGNNEYRRIICNDMLHVTNYEHTKYGILLDPSKITNRTAHFGLKSPHTISPNYLTAFIKKSHLVIRMLELRFGQPVLLQVLNKLLVLARLSASSVLPNGSVASGNHRDESNAHDEQPDYTSTAPDCSNVPPCLSDENQANLLLSTSSFRRIILMVTGQDIQNFLDQWVFRTGHVRLFVKFHFNRKRNVVELELKQDLQSRGTLSYTGPLTVMLQELDGAFMHTFKLEEGRMARDLPCHSKSRKHRKKRIPLANGDEVDMDLGRIDAESPLLWVRMDPDLAVIHTIYVEQPDFMWHLMLLHDRDCLGQLEATHALRDFPSPETRHALANVIANERVFYRVRTDACFSLCHIANELSAMGGAQGTTANAATSVLLPLFWQLFSSPAARGLVRQNNFKHLQHYFLMRAICRSLATLRVQQVCPREVLPFISELLRHNDNTRNEYSDYCYLADLIRTMKDILTPAIVVRGVMSSSSLPVEARTVIEEVVHHLNLDTQTPSYKGTITVVCLATIRRLQRLGFLPVDPSLFYLYASPGFYYDVRLAGLECLVDYVRGERDQPALDWIFNEVIERDDGTDSSHARLRFEAVQLFLRMPPFQRGETGSRLDTPQLVCRLWNLMNYGCGGDSRLRCAVADLYHMLYGNRRPTCLPLPEGVLLVRVKEGRSVLNLTASNEARVEGDNDLTVTRDPGQTLDSDEDEISDGLEDIYSELDLDSTSRMYPRQFDSAPKQIPNSSILGETRVSAVADEFVEYGIISEGKTAGSCHAKRPFSVHSGSELSLNDSSSKRRMQRLSDDEED